MQNSWIKLHRQLFDWEWYTDSKTVHLFIHMLLKANYKPSKWRGVDICAGQLLTGRKQLAKETGISERSVRTILERLKATSELTIKSTSKFSIITLCNYSKYQIEKIESDQQNDQPDANERPATDQQATTSKKKKNLKEKDNTCPQQAGGPPNCPHSDIVDLYHFILPELPRIRIWSDERQSHLRARWKEDESRQNIKWWEGFFKYISGCPFLMGQVEYDGRSFEPNLEWIVKKANFIKIIEGKYEDRTRLGS